MGLSYQKKPKVATTLSAALEASLLAAARYNRGVEDKPAAILWTDADGQWQPLIGKLLERLPQLVVLGDYDPAQRRGPAIWLKCVIARSVDIGLPTDAVPIVYLPNVSRQVLRAAADCPELLQPLVELQYRGVVWTQRNWKDWTIEAFLVSDDGLGLDVARDEAKQRIRPMLGFKRFETAAVTIQGIELAEKIKKQQFNLKPLTGKATSAPDIWAAVLSA